MTFFALGFRPFFLGAGLYAAIATLLWLLAWSGVIDPALPLSPAYWHGHEMLFGFAAAGLTGFLLTAVPSWTDTGPVRGARLVILFALWLAARVLAWSEAGPIFSIVDSLFLPLLIAFVAPGILARNAKRNGVIVLLLGLLAVANIAFHAEAADLVGSGARWGLYLALDLFVLFLTLIGGRIVPAFTIGGMRMAGEPVAIAPIAWLDRASILSAAAVAATEALLPQSLALSLVAALAALLNGARFLRWQGWRTWSVPLVFVLHLGYAWLVIGLALKALAAGGLIAPAIASHSLTAGAVGTMILAVMSRASLGHTGRKLEADRATALAYGFVTLGAVLRVAGPWTDFAADAILAAGLAWAAGYALFAIRFWPILTRPRIDGRPG
ncbi:MAG: NnrS family protein [Alphaproteobacteria bacterium]